MSACFKFRGTHYELFTNGELTDKEETEAVAIMLGLTCKESAKQRGVSPETAKCQRASAKAKVAAHSQVEFVMHVMASGWLRSFLRGFLVGASRRAVPNPSLSRTSPMIPGHAQHNPDLRYLDVPGPQRQHLIKLKGANQRRYAQYLLALHAAVTHHPHANVGEPSCR